MKQPHIHWRGTPAVSAAVSFLFLPSASLFPLFTFSAIIISLPTYFFLLLSHKSTPILYRPVSFQSCILNFSLVAMFFFVFFLPLTPADYPAIFLFILPLFSAMCLPRNCDPPLLSFFSSAPSTSLSSTCSRIQIG